MSDIKQNYADASYSIAYTLSSYFYTQSKKDQPITPILKSFSKLFITFPELICNGDFSNKQFTHQEAKQALEKLSSFCNFSSVGYNNILAVIKAINIVLEKPLEIEDVDSKDSFDFFLDCFALNNNLTVKQLKQDIVYLLMCKSLSTLSKAKRLQVGEIIVTEQETLLPGYNGTAPNTSNECEYTDPDTGKLISHEHIICGLQNAVYKAAKQGVSVIGSTAYSTHSPCVRCVPVTLSVGIKRFVYTTEYRLTDHLTVLKENKIPLLQISSKILEVYQRYY